MFEKIVITERGRGVDKKGIGFSSFSQEEIKILAFDTATGSEIEVIIKKDDIPDWIKKGS